MAYTSKNPRFETLTLTDQGSAGVVANPASGSHRFVDRNGQVFLRDSSGNEVGVGSGVGEINVIAYPNTAGSSWVASGAGITVATTTTASDLPLSGVIPTAIKITPVSGTDYVRYRFTMPEGLKSTKLKISHLQRPLSGYAAGDVKVDLYTNSASNYGGSYTRVALSSDVSSVSGLPNYTGLYKSTFDAGTADYYELRYTRVSGTTAINVTSVILGPGAPSQGAALSDSLALGTGGVTVTYNNLGTVTDKSYWRRSGNMLEIDGLVTLGTTAASTASIVIAGVTFDTTKVQFSSAPAIGRYDATTSGSQSIYTAGGQNGILFLDGTNANTIYFSQTTNSSAYTKSTGSAAFNSSQTVMWKIRVPILEWAGQGVVNTVASDTVTNWTTYTPTVVGFGTATVSASYKRIGDSIIVKGSVTSGTSTAVPATFPLPTGLTVFGTPITSGYNYFGSAARSLATGNAVKQYSIIAQSGDSALRFSVFHYVSAVNPLVPQNGDNLLGSGDIFNFETGPIPITEWQTGASPLVGFAQATPTAMGLVLGDKVETRTNSSTVTANGTVLFNFSSLTAGKRYRVMLSARIATADNSGTISYARILHNSEGTTVGKLGTEANVNVDGGAYHVGTVVDIPTLVGTRVQVDWASTDTGTASISEMTCTLVEVNSQTSGTFGT